MPGLGLLPHRLILLDLVSHLRRQLCLLLLVPPGALLQGIDSPLVGSRTLGLVELLDGVPQDGESPTAPMS